MLSVYKTGTITPACCVFEVKGGGNSSLSMTRSEASLVPKRYVLFYGLRGLCVGRVDQFDRFRCEAPGRIRFDFWSGLRFLERTQ